MTRTEAALALAALAATVREEDHEAAAGRLLERLSEQEAAEELRAALVVVGAMTIIREVRP